MPSPPTTTATRQPFPFAAEARHQLVGLGYRILGAALGRVFHKNVRLSDLQGSRILILKPCCLGDVVFSTPLIRELRRNLPDARLDYAVGKHSRAALASAPLDGVVDVGPLRSGLSGLRDLLSLAWRVRAGRYDACFVLERSALLALVPLLAGVPSRIGIDSGGRGFSLSVGVSPRPIRAEAELYLDLLRAVGGTVASPALEYHPSKEGQSQVEALLAEHGLSAPFVVLHAAGGVNPGMTLRRKRWPVAHFVALGRRIQDSGAAVVLVGSAEDRETADLVERGLTAAGRAVNLAGALSLDQVAALAGRAAVYVGNDSGPTHLAEAAGARVVALFGPSDPLQYGPRGRNAVALSAGLWCSPCFEDGRVAPCAQVRCMAALPVERVWREVARCLSDRRSAPDEADE